MPIELFKAKIWNYFTDHQRSFVWREHISPYKVVVSELMLQQTQTYRVEPKFIEFVSVFPDFASLAQASFSEILRLWKGLGYNRRARYLQQIAQQITEKHAGELPCDPKILEDLPGIGPATARSIITFAYNIPTVFIETNIRAVFLEHFFAGEAKVHDKQILPLIEQSLDHAQPRLWYYALMDYGVHLKKLHNNPSRRSAHHVLQSQFKGSNRQVRGKILELLLADSRLSQQQICASISKSLELFDQSEQMVDKALLQLCEEKSVRKSDEYFFELNN